ncbi:MAG: hypothetical protein R3C52_04415 [Hyphomonadaceae bacterium]
MAKRRRTDDETIQELMHGLSRAADALGETVGRRSGDASRALRHLAEDAGRESVDLLGAAAKEVHKRPIATAANVTVAVVAVLALRAAYRHIRAQRRAVAPTGRDRLEQDRQAIAAYARIQPRDYAE